MISLLLGISKEFNQEWRSRISCVVLTEVVWRSQRGEHTGEKLQTHLDLRAVAVPARRCSDNVECQCSQTLICNVNVRFLNSQCKLMPVFPNFLDVVLQVVKEQLHHVQFLLSPPDRGHQQINT